MAVCVGEHVRAAGRGEEESEGTSGKFKASERLDLLLLALKMKRAMSQL